MSLLVLLLLCSFATVLVLGLALVFARAALYANVLIELDHAREIDRHRRRRGRIGPSIHAEHAELLGIADESAPPARPGAKRARSLMDTLTA